MSTTTTRSHQQAPPPADRQPRWEPGRVILLALAVFALLGAAASFVGAGWLGHVDDHRRDGEYLTTDTHRLHTDGHALAVQEIDLDGLSGDEVLGDVRLRATSDNPDASVFVGIAPTEEVESYLRGVDHTTVTDVDDPEAHYVDHDGGAPATDPAALDIWVAQASGPGTQGVEWTPEEGSWTAVIMNTDGSEDVDVQADVGATVPLLEHLVGALWIGGAALALVGAALGTAGFLRRRG
jgi:hypothetical protein